MNTNASTDARRAIARELSKYYTELSGDERPTPRFSLARTLSQMAEPHGLRDGYEREICGATAIAASESFDKHRVMIPLQALQTRDLTVASPSGGGYLVATESGSPIDVLRPWSVVAQAGISVVSGLRSNLALPRVTGASSGGWATNEGSSFADSQPTLGQAVLTPKTAAVMLEFSRQWALQAEAAEQLLRQQLMRAVGELIDVAFFAGTGINGQPTGLLNTAGISTFSGSTLALAGLLEARDEILAAGGQEDRLRWVSTPAVQKLLTGRFREAGSGRSLWDNDGILGRPAAATKNAPTGTLIAGDYGQAVLGIFGPAALRLEINPFGSSANFIGGIVQARVVVSLDFAFPQPAAFSVATSIT